MAERKLNLTLKEGIGASVLLKYGFAPKYDEDTGEIKEYRKKIHIEGAGQDEKHFTFVLYTKNILGGIFRRSFYYKAWMTGFSWDDICQKEALQLLYDLIIDGIVEPDEPPRTPKERGGEK